MSRYIDAKEVEKRIDVVIGSEPKAWDKKALKELKMYVVHAVPTADVRENVRGNLVNIEPSITVIDVIDTPSGGALLSMDKACSKCKTPIPPNLCDDVWFKYCPFCGAEVRI